MRTFLQICSLILLLIQSSKSFKLDSRFYEISKRDLIAKEKKYLKDNPLSEEMKSFIRRSKRLSHPLKRSEDIDKDRLYVVENGEIKPFDDLKISGDGRDQFSSAGNFTVVPLIIPVTVAVLDTSPTEEEIINLQDDTIETTQCETYPPTRRHRPRIHKPTPTTEIVIEILQEESTEHKVDAAMLEKVIGDVKQLIQYEQEERATGPEATLCNVTGDWDSDAGGVQIRLETIAGNYRYPHAVVVEREPPPNEPGFLDEHWKMNAFVPLNHSSLVILNGYSRRAKRVASFIGECRVCNGDDTITGNWLIARKSKNCKDRQGTQKFLSDILRRNNVRRLQAEHLQEITAPVPSTM